MRGLEDVEADGRIGTGARALTRRRHPLISREGDVLVLVVYGVPAPKGNKRLSATGAMYESAKGLSAWVRALDDAMDELELRYGAGAILPDVPLEASARFYLPRPKSVRRDLPTAKPDLSKLLRALEDPLNGRAYVDDARIVRWTALKLYAEAPGDERAELRIRPNRPPGELPIWGVSRAF